ncbi:hypothetical protein CPB85DRAFT_478951 [Mucidula mucida]|nr:hypothetical protein CPB85DRAFT_478951 [Mucidula mucida]
MFMFYLVCLHKLSLSDRSGLPPTGILQNPKPYLENYSDYAKVNEDWYNILSGQVLLLQDQTGPFEVTLGRVIDRQTGIIGRCTFIVNATCTMRWPGIELIVKITWSPTSRTSEAEFMQSVQEVAAHSGADWVLDHVPNILHSQDFPHLPDQVGGRLSAFLNSLHEDDWASSPGEFKYEDRVMRVSVHEKLYKLSELDTVSNHAQVFHDVVQVHRWLYDFPRILHRDISHSNIMWHRRRGRICGVLNDFDLSSFRDNTTLRRSSALARAPTWPGSFINKRRNLYAISIGTTLNPFFTCFYCSPEHMFFWINRKWTVSQRRNVTWWATRTLPTRNGLACPKINFVRRKMPWSDPDSSHTRTRRSRSWAVGLYTLDYLYLRAVLHSRPMRLI